MTRVLALFSNHNIVSNSHHHMICFKCKSIPVSDWNPPISLSPPTLAVFKSFLPAFKSSHDLRYEALDDDDMVVLTALKRSNIDYIANIGKIEPVKVFRFFMYLRLGIGQRPLAVLVDSGQSTLSDELSEVIKAIEGPLALKFLRFSRESIINDHTPPLFAALLPHARIGTDGEYWYTEKPADFHLQKKSYSLIKNQNLITALSAICLDGTRWDVLDLYFADSYHNDEMKYEYAFLNDTAGIRTHVLTDPNDEVVVDRYPSFTLFLF